MNYLPKAWADERDAEQIVRELLARRLGYVPEWRPGDKGADVAIAKIAARFIYAIIQRLNQAPEKNKLAFLDLLGQSLVPARAARAPIVFKLAADSTDAQAPAGTQVAAPPPPGGSDQVVFETERATGVAAARLKEVVSLWPGRDQYIDHSASFLAGGRVQSFRKADLQDTPHAIYIAHDTLLALAGSAEVTVEFELTQVSGEPLSILWHYWDGKVWRGFKYVRPACSIKDARNADSSAGFTASGSFILAADCAESAKTKVNGVEAFWIRGQLTEVLPPDPTNALPLIESVRLTSVIDQKLKARLTTVVKDEPFAGGAASTQIQGTVLNEAGEPLTNINVKVSSPDDPNSRQESSPIDGDGHFPPLDAAGNPTIAPVVMDSQRNYEMQVAFLNLEASTLLRDLEPGRELTVNLTFNVDGLDPDKAFADGTKLDVTKPFYPFGQQPQPGATFYFNSEEVFSKPRASVQIYVAKTFSPQDAVDINPGGANPVRESLPHLVAWEYWNGRRWSTMFFSSDPAGPNPKDLTQTEIIEFDVPGDIAKTRVNEEEGLWMRARLVSGGFGFKATVPVRAGQGNNNFTFVITQPPALAAFRIGYTWPYGPFPPERVLTFNDFQYEDHTYEAIWPGRTFSPFARVRDITPALYLGFDKKLPVDNIGLYFDILEELGDSRGPAMVWEYFNGSEWRELSAEDETRNLRLPGILSFIAAEDSQPLARFGTERHWVRGSLKEDGPPGEPVIRGIFPNAVWASQHRTLAETPLGASTGLPNQVLRFTQIPVLEGERIEVQELSGARANVEWRILVDEVARDGQDLISEFEEMLGREGAQTEFVKGDLRLRRDRNKRVVEVWVRWKEQPHFFNSGADNRHYVIDRARGLVFFGDGVKGKIPPPRAPVASKRHRSGGGLVGNVAARAIKQILAPVPGVQEVFNPRAAEGGADGETVDRFGLRGPQTLRHRGRAITPADYETLAREASPAVAVARAIPLRNVSGRSIPGWITLLIIPQSNERRPWPSFGLREHVRKFISERGPAGVAAAEQIYVTGPDYLPIEVRATLAPKVPSEAGKVEQRGRQAIEDFLHPLRGGPEGRGWELGRDLYLSDLAAVLERVEGLDYVKELAVLVNGGFQGDRVAVADERVVVAGEIRLKLEAAEA